MGNRLLILLVLSALCLGFAVSPAEASESRVANFLFTCDGTNKVFPFTVGGLGNSVTRFIQGAEVILFENHGGLQYILLAAAGPNRQLVSLSSADNRASNQFTGFLQVTTGPTGDVQFAIQGACNPGAGQVQGTATVWFFN